MQLLAIDQTGATLAPTEGAPTVVAEVVRATVALYSKKGYQPPWIGYLGVENGECVGGCGFAGPPSDGEVEIAYFAFPGNEGRGVATRIPAELIRITRNNAQGVLSYIAHTLPQDGASTSILRKLGFVLEGEITHPEDGQVWKWREARNAET